MYAMKLTKLNLKKKLDVVGILIGSSFDIISITPLQINRNNTTFTDVQDWIPVTYKTTETKLQIPLISCFLKKSILGLNSAL